MAEYLILGENITFKNGRLSCINILDRFTTVAMPAEFQFDLAIICGPNWKPGEHKLKVKAKTNTGKEIPIGDLTVNIPDEDFVYNAYAHDLKIIMDYSIEHLTFCVYDNDKEIISRKYKVVSMLVPQKQNTTKAAKTTKTTKSKK